ncbi:MAG: chitosanase [Acidobacteria bacterium]|nr:MAG: chitosanase [Acidobacteriota bacterium]
MTLTNLQKKTATAIVNVFETGRILGDYGAVGILPGDTGHLSYGRSQVTLGSGNLYRLLQTYCDTPGAAIAAELSPYLDRFQRRDFTLDTDIVLRGLLSQAGQDPAMQTTQDQFFDANYWAPAASAAADIAISSALGISVVYDSHVQGAWRTLRDRTVAQFGTPDAVDENGWISHYVDTRRVWLATNPNLALHPTVYRMDVFRALIQDSRWDLALPIAIRGITIDENSLGGNDAPRTLRLTTPPMTGDDVRALQQAFAAAGTNLAVDGVFGQQTHAAVRQFQQQQGLVADGDVGAVTRSALGL